MTLDRSRLGFAVIALLLAALFVRLGFWQLDRHAERQRTDDLRRERMARPALQVGDADDLASLPPRDSLAWRRVRLRGMWDFEREILLSPRSHEGRPAVELLTPLVTGGGTAVLVLRGWLPAPDALHAPIRRARPAGDSAIVEGVAVAPASGRSSRAGATTAPTRVVVDGEEHLTLRAPDLETASDHIPYPIANFYIRQSQPEGARSAPRPLPRADPGPGPHLSYAIQWFAFALIAVAGTAAFLLRGR